MKVKVCGLKYLNNILSITGLNIDYAGFIFYKGSPRYISNSLSFEEVRMIPESVKKVGVFVNESAYSVLNTVAHYDLNLVQLHGSESEAYCSELRQHVKIIKAFSIIENFDFSQLKPFINNVDYFLFDTPAVGHGGSGKTFDWRILRGYDHSVPYFLSGGMGVESLEELAKLDIPEPYALDINSKFETEPGLKNEMKVNEFLKELKQYEKANEFLGR